ncbi:hypothetical protein L210DRAFT_875408 [Boletus edulis BED1]|uniref:Uncharacterized protein n=1 Tax=Boletus edulis BED1 TaxID=1328754 RepID=A0AAD4BGL4_BOLED|nr:hypothetical protein L210DRAFT_875408 [Boletus edulis BED1]
MHRKLLCITCDNASNNLAMIHALEFELPDYGGEAGHARCFLHTTNLVAKSLLRVFEVRKGSGVASGGGMSVDEERLALEICELNDDVDGLEDEMAMLSREEVKELQNAIRPVQLALAKVDGIL